MWWAYPSSKRTWSLPFPVAPWDTASAPTCFAISIWRLAISGRAIDVPRRYTPSYSEFALQVTALSLSGTLYTITALRVSRCDSQPLARHRWRNTCRGYMFKKVRGKNSGKPWMAGMLKALRPLGATIRRATRQGACEVYLAETKLCLVMQGP